MNFIDELLHSKTGLCPHSSGCVMAALKQSLKNLKYGLLISVVLQLIRTLKVIAKDASKLKSSLKPQYFSIAIFLSSTVFILKIVHCILRRLRQRQDGLNSLLSGAMAGWVASKTLSKDYWYFYLTFIGSRLIGAGHKFLMSKQILSQHNAHWHSYFMMTIAHGIHSYGYFLHPYILNDDMYGLYKKMSALTPQQKKWHLTSLKFNNRRVIQKFGAYPSYDAITNTRIRQLQHSIERQNCHK